MSLGVRCLLTDKARWTECEPSLPFHPPSPAARAACTHAGQMPPRWSWRASCRRLTWTALWLSWHRTQRRTGQSARRWPGIDCAD
eukprot:273636-Chlamydomonas_euryale.AAC.2